MYFALLICLAAAKDLQINGNLEVDQTVTLQNLETQSLAANTVDTNEVDVDMVNADSITVDDITIDRIIPTNGVLKIQGDVVVHKIANEDETQTSSSSSSAEQTSFLQWEEYSVSTFEDSFQFWDRQDLSSCFEGGDQFLGGHCNFAGDEVSRTYVLPKHSSLRITAAYHMLDGWNGELGYMKIDGYMAWKHKSTSHSKGINICGGEDSDRINIPIDVDIPHTAGNVTLTFGSELEVDPCVASFGIDDVVVYYK